MNTTLQFVGDMVKREEDAILRNVNPRIMGWSELSFSFLQSIVFIKKTNEVFVVSIENKARRLGNVRSHIRFRPRSFTILA